MPRLVFPEAVKLLDMTSARIENIAPNNIVQRNRVFGILSNKKSNDMGAQQDLSIQLHLQKPHLSRLKKGRNYYNKN